MNVVVITTAVVLLIGVNANANAQEKRITLDSTQYAALIRVDSLARQWYKKNTQPGIKYDTTSFTFDEEARRIISDPVYRHSIFKNPYTWKHVKFSLEKNNLKLAFWQMLNLYPKNKHQVMKFILAYDKLIPTDEVVTSAYYTYAILDPRITTITSGKPDLKRPDILEEIFHDMNEVVEKIISYREATKTR